MKLIEKIIHEALSTDPNSRALLEPLIHKTLALNLTTLEKTVYLSFSASSIRLLDTAPQTLDVTITTSLKTACYFALTKNYHDAIKAGLTISGDLDTAQQIQHLFLTSNIDWGALIAPYLGDTVAHAFETTGAKTKALIREKKENLNETFREYVLTEALLVPSDIELNTWMNDVDALRSDVERLAVRLKNLERVLNPC